VATFAESGFSAKIAQAYIYKAPWFVVWLGVLCVNLFAVTLTRIPWERKHLGFIVTHYGIIVLLAGAMIGLHSGFEGNVTLRKDAAPVTRVVTNRSIIQVENPFDGAQYVMPFDAELERPGEKRERIFEVPDTEWRIVADAYAPSLVREPVLVPGDVPGAAAAVHLRLASRPLRQEVQKVLSLGEAGSGEEDFFGMATLRLVDRLPPPQAPGVAETRMVFANFAPVIDPDAAVSSISVRLSEDGSRVGIFAPDGTGAIYLREEMMRKPLSEAGSVVVVEEYWPDFVMVGGSPASASEAPRNPAILVRLFAVEGDEKPELEMAVADEKLEYRLSRRGHTYASGRAAVGDSFALGWADWTAEVVGVSGKALVAESTRPGEVAGGDAEATPGFRARLEGPGGARGPSRWVESGRVTSLTDGRQVVRVGYGLETRPLPFSVRLVNFEVPRDEGTDAPADFRATVEFQDFEGGKSSVGVARMNRPASHPGTLWGNLSGLTYKFSQAEWNPRNLDETTLQVLYDPGWLLKWVGSLGICLGIFLQFYGKPRASSSTPPKHTAMPATCGSAHANHP
jgi:hypothetical protein